MGFPAFAKFFRYGILAAVALAAAVLAAIALATPAAAKDGGGRGLPARVDTDNLKYTGTVNGRSYTYSAKSFGIPYLEPNNRGGEAACGGGGVADAFFQRSAIRNDMPVVDTSKSEFALTTPGAAGACTAFVQEQNRAQSEAGSNGGYYLDVEGKLGRGLPLHFATDRVAGNDRRVSSNSSSNGFWVSNGRIHYTTQHRSTYADRVDLEVGSDFRYAVHVDPPLNPSSIQFVIPDPPVVKSARSGGSVSWVPDFSQVSGVTIGNAKALGWGYFQGGGHIGAYCPALLHPRGEDAVRRIGTGTGRTLSSLKLEANVQAANWFWCRSDKRYVISYETEIELGVTCSTDGAPPCPSKFRLPANGEEARYYGRVNCYRTVLELKTTATSQTDRNSCAYIFPLPQCTHNGAKTRLNSVQIAKHQIGAVFPFASDGSTACDTNPRCTANGAKRDMTDAELQAYRTARGASFTPASDGSTPCTAAVAASAAADFTSDACVTAILEIYENRPKGFNAEPGVRADHRTVAADAASPVFDLDVAAAHPGTASPPRASGDPSGCADGSESRADHGTADSAARKNTAAEDAVTADEVDLPKSSAAVNWQSPPHSKSFGSPGTDYTGAVRNIAHRYASDVAENTCAAAREFAELVLEILKGRRLVFQSYIDGYEDIIDTAIAGYSSYSTTIQSGSENSANAYNNLSLKAMRQNALERQREKYVKDRQEYLGLLKAALIDAETAYQRATDSTKLVLGSVDSNGCINSYDNAITGEIAKLKNLAEAAETAFPSTAIARNVTLTNKTYRATNSITNPNKTTGGTDRFMRLYNALSLTSYTNQVPNYTVTSSPESDTRPADNNLTWTLGDWSDASRTYSCAHLNPSPTAWPRYLQQTVGNTVVCVKHRQDTSPVNNQCPTGYRYKDGWPPKCIRQGEDGEEETTSVTYSCNNGWTRMTDPNNPFLYICTRWVVDSTRTARYRDYYKRTDNYRNVVSGTVTGTLSGTTGKKANFSRTYTGSRICEYATGTITSGTLRRFASRTSPRCGTGAAITHNAATGTTLAAAKATVEGTAHSVTLPSEAQMTTARPSALAAITESSLLGKLHPSHSSRANLKAASTAARNTAAANLGTLTQNGGGTTVIPSRFAAALNYTAGGTSAYAARFAPPASTAQRTTIATAATNYINEYAKAYQTAYSQAAGDMGSTATTTAWNNFAWSYETSSLAWGGYLADEGQPARSRGCYLIDVAGDGKVTVQTARMDFETGHYAVGETYSFLFSGERNCKIKRTRTPQLNLKYQPNNPTDTDGGFAAGYFHTDYQPNPADERFKLAAETEIFTIRAKVADSPPVFCGTTLPADGYLSHTAGQMASVPAVIVRDSWRSAAQLTTTLRRPASDPPAVTKDHCFARPRLTAADKPRLVVFDDTAHSDMNLVYLQKDPTDTTGINLFTGGAFTKYALETYQYPGDNSQQSVFYGAIWEPPDNLGSSTGWDILDDNNPNTDLNTKIKNRIVARDKTAAPNLPAVPADTTFKHVSAMGFNIGFLDCRPDIENVVFIGNIVSATAASNQANDYAGITSASGYPMNAPQWYYPAWSEIKGKTRTTDGSTVAVGPNSGIYTHPRSAQYGWVMETVNHISIDKQPISAFRNLPDVKRDPSARPADVTLEEHRQVCFGDRTAIPHYRSADAARQPENPAQPPAEKPTMISSVWTAEIIQKENCSHPALRCFAWRL